MEAGGFMGDWNDDRVLQFHPIDDKGNYQNIHPEFDHGIRRASGIIDELAKRSAPYLAKFCGGTAPAAPPPEEPSMCKNTGAGSPGQQTAPKATVQPPPAPHSSLCTAEQASAAGNAAESAEIALARATGDVSRLKNQLSEKESRVRALQDEIGFIKKAIAQAASLVETRKSSGLDSSDARRTITDLERDLSGLQGRLPKTTAERDDLTAKSTVADQAKNAAQSAYLAAIAEATRCQFESEKRTLAEDVETRRKASAEKSQHALAEMKAQQAAAEKELVDQDRKAAVSEFHKKQVAGQVPSTIQAPMCANDFVESCKAGDVKKEATYFCTYAQAAKNRAPRIVSNPAVSMSDENSTALKTLFNSLGAYSDFGSITGKINKASSVALPLLGLKAVKLPTVPGFTLPTMMPLGYVDDLLIATEFMAEKMKLIRSIEVPVHVQVFEMTESFSCPADGAAWQMDWKKEEPASQSVLDEIVNVEFTCGGMFSDRGDNLLDLSTVAGNPPCSLPNEKSELPAVLARHAWRALPLAIEEANAPTSDSRCPANPPQDNQ